MNKTVREYIKLKLNNDDYVTITDGDRVTANIGICRNYKGDKDYSLSIIIGNFHGTEYCYESLSHCFNTLSRWEREGRCVEWMIPDVTKDKENINI